MVDGTVSRETDQLKWSLETSVAENRSVVKQASCFRVEGR